jgi:hypothetical protein
MALISGKPEKQPGDRLVYGALGRLPDSWIVYAQPRLVHGTRKRKPDYVVVHRDLGVIVLEVKDWPNVTSCSSRRAWINTRGRDREKRCTSPVEQAEQACYVLNKMLEQDPDLTDKFGELCFPYRCAGILPYLDQMSIYWLEKYWGKNLVLGPEDLLPGVFESRLREIPAPFNVRLSENQIKAIHSIIDPDLQHRREQASLSCAVPRSKTCSERKLILHRPAGNVKPGQLLEPGQPEAVGPGDQMESHDAHQGCAADPGGLPDPEVRIARLEKDMPQGVRDLIPDARIQLLRGPAGSGKTDFLVLRAHFLKDQDPDLSVLITTTDDHLYQQRLRPELSILHPDIRVEKLKSLCEQLFLEYTGRRIHPADSQTTLGEMADGCRYFSAGEVPFLAEEITWMKESGRVTRKKYVDGIREGRGKSWKRLTAADRQRVFRVFKVYQKTLDNRFAYDWADVHKRVRSFLENGFVPREAYDVILVDRAQDFPPGSLYILKNLLKPDGSLFLCEDPSEGLYSEYSWREKGVSVMGRTRCLHISRSTRQIARAAWSLIQDTPLAMERLCHGFQQETLPEFCRDGPRPLAVQIPKALDQRHWILDEIGRVIGEEGVLPCEIAILHKEEYVLERYRGQVPDGVNICSVNQRGEPFYRVVFLPEIEGMLDRDTSLSLDEDVARMRVLVHAAASRAQMMLYMLHKGRWPTILLPMLQYLNHLEAGDTLFPDASSCAAGESAGVVSYCFQ